MLRLQLLGRVAGDLDGVPVEMPTSERARALIGWLALHPGRHDRADVAAVLWPDADPERARANLRTAVWTVHQAWGPAAGWLQAGRTWIGLDDATWVDARGEPADASAQLLPGCDDEWLEAAREEHRRAVVRTLAGRASAAERDGDLDAAVRISEEICRVELYDEGAHRQLVRRLLLVGDRASAILASRVFSERLRTELGVAPSPSTRAAHAEATGGTGGPGTASESRPRLFGRAEEVTRLVQLWRLAARGAGQVVVVAGEPGIGKSSVVGELVGRVEATGGRTAGAVGVDVAGHTPFAVWLELGRRLAETCPAPPPHAVWPRELNRLSAEIGTRLGDPGAPVAVMAPELERLRVFESVLRLVEWSCADRPTLLVVDDAHRADRASLRLTGHVGRRLPHLPLLLVLTRRDGVDGGELDAMLADLAAHGVPVTHLPLGPIDDRALAVLASSIHRLDDEELRRVVSAADGNPLLAVEATRALAAGDAGPPPDLRLAVRASVGRLPQGAADLVRTLAVAGRPLTAAELDRLEVEHLAAAEDAAVAEGLLVRRTGRLGFRHDLLREAVYADLRSPALLHDRVARVIDPDQHADVGHHLALAGRDREAAHQLALAAAAARTMGALDSALEFLTRATELDPRDGELWLELEEVCAWSGRTEEMESAWDQALALLPEADLARAWIRRGQQHRSVVCRPEAARRAYLTAQQLLPADSEARLRAECLLGLAWSDAVAGTGRAYEAHLRTAEALLGGRTDARTDSDIAEIRMQGLIRHGEFRAAIDLALAAASRAVSARLPDRAWVILIHAACIRTCLGDLDGALELADRAVTVTRDVPAIHHGSLSARALVLARLGRHAEAAEAAERLQALSERLGSAEVIGTAAHDAGLVALAAGRYAEAADLIERALAQAAPVSRPGALLREAEALALAGDPERATEALRRAVTAPVTRADQSWSLVPRVAFVQAVIAIARGDAGRALERLTESEAAWRRVVGSAESSRTADGYLATMVDLGRPPIVGLVEPQRELDRITTLRHTLLPSPTAR